MTGVQTCDLPILSSRTLSQIANLSGNSINELYHEIEKRELVLRYMHENGIRSVEDVNFVLESYYKSPEEVLSKILSR